MSKLNFLVYLNTYSDASASNNPSLSNFKWAREISGVPASNPISEAFSLAPGENRSIFSGTRTILADNTTRYSISLKPLSSSTYRVEATAGTSPAFRTARATGANATTQVTTSVNGPIVTYSSPASASAVAASFTGTPTGFTTPVTLTANTAGLAGNSILLTGDGTTDLVGLASAWNTANPSNGVNVVSGDNSQILDNGATIQLSGGLNAVVGLNMAGVSVGDMVRIGDQFNILNQGEYKILAKSANSFTVENQTAVNEGPITLGSTFANQIRIYSAAGVQRDDTLIIADGFSSVTFGSYKVTDVTDYYIEFYSTNVLPQETGIASNLSIYSQAKNLIYLESDQKAQVTVNGSVVANMEPFIINNSRQPGVFMLKSTVWSFSVTNSSSDTAQCFVATVE